MGDICRIICLECNSLWDVDTGYGLVHGMKERVIDEFPKALKKRAEKELASDPEPFFSFRPAVCERCRAFVQVPVLSDSSSGRVILKGYCQKCGVENVRLEDRPEDAVCPSCGALGLKTEITGKWD